MKFFSFSLTLCGNSRTYQCQDHLVFLHLSTLRDPPDEYSIVYPTCAPRVCGLVLTAALGGSRCRGRRATTVRTVGWGLCGHGLALSHFAGLATVSVSEKTVHFHLQKSCMRYFNTLLGESSHFLDEVWCKMNHRGLRSQLVVSGSDEQELASPSHPSTVNRVGLLSN